MNITVISSVKFSKSKNGNWRGECTVTLANGDTAYPRLTGAALDAVIVAIKAAGAPITGVQRQVALRDGTGTAVITEYRTVPVRFTADIFGAYLDAPKNITVVGVSDAAAIEEAIAGVATPMAPSNKPRTAVTVAEPEMD